MATYTEITIEQMREVLRKDKGWRNATCGAVQEHVIEFPLSSYPGVVIRVYTSLNLSNGQTRACGSDAIRVCAVDLFGNDGRGRGVIKAKRVHRVAGWRNNLKKRVMSVLKHAKEVMQRRLDKGEWTPPVEFDTVSNSEEDLTNPGAYPRTCEKCRGAGTYGWGACINGKMEHTGICYQCEGKGYMTFADAKRCEAYWNHALGSAMGGDLAPGDFERVDEPAY